MIIQKKLKGKHIQTMHQLKQYYHQHLMKIMLLHLVYFQDGSVVKRKGEKEEDEPEKRKRDHVEKKGVEKNHVKKREKEKHEENVKINLF